MKQKIPSLNLGRNIDCFERSLSFSFFSTPSTISEMQILIFFPSSPTFNRVKLIYVSFKFYVCASERFSLSNVILYMYSQESRKLTTFLALNSHGNFCNIKP